jgi:hypothetical protein
MVDLVMRRHAGNDSDFDRVSADSHADRGGQVKARRKSTNQVAVWASPLLGLGHASSEIRTYFNFAAFSPPLFYEDFGAV